MTERKARQRILTAAVALCYLLLGCLVYWPVAPWSSNRIIDGAYSDPVQEVWFLHWTAFAIAHGHNPFFTYYLHAPAGANLALNTTFPLLGLVGAPITWLAGPLVTYNVLLRLALATSAFAMYAVLRRYTRWQPAAFAGGLLYGFSPYMIGHAHRHLFLTFVPLLPLLIPVLDDWLVGRRRNPYLSGLYVGLLVAAEYLISPEVALLMVLAALLGVLVLAVRHATAVRSRLGALVRGIAVAVPVTGALIAYPVYLLLDGPERPNGPIHVLSSLEKYAGDLVAPVVPTRGEFFSPAGSGANLVNHSVEENGFYLGIPLLVLLLVAVVWLRRLALVQVSVVVGVVAFVFGLGTTLKVNGSTVFGNLPFAAVAKLPVLQNIEPARLSLFLQLPTAIVLALALDRWRGRGRTRAGLACALAVAALAPLVPRLPLRTAPVHVPAYIASDAVDAIPQGALAFTYPYSRTPNDDPMLWQSAAGMRFRIFGGMAFVPDATGASTYTPLPPSPPDVYPFYRAELDLPMHPLSHYAGIDATLRSFLLRYRVQVVLIDTSWRRADEVTAVVTSVLGRAPERRGGMAVWTDVPGLINRA